MDCTDIFKAVKKASKQLNILDGEVIDRTIRMAAEATVSASEAILAANSKDLAQMDVADPKYDRLKLTTERVSAIADDMLNVASLQDPTGRVLSINIRPDGLKISRISTPFGVVGVIYEARPNVTFDLFALSLKSRNACILKGGSDAINSNTATVELLRGVLAKNGIDPDVLALLPAGREETTQLLNARDYVDLIIPRGSRGLIDYVRDNATIPVIETGAGICHTYFESTGNKDTGRLVINNAKTRRVSVCNALDCLIIDRSRLDDLPYLVGLCENSDVTIYADEPAYSALSGIYPARLLEKADTDSYGTEFLSYKMAVKTVENFNEAVDHIEKYGSKHSEAIISENNSLIQLFYRLVDASSVYSNASTAFTDGAQFGLGAEIGISTQKLHARGPMALEALTTYKWIIEGNGQIRS